MVWICLRWSGWWFLNIFYVHPYLGKINILTNIFQMGWNHQPAWFGFVFFEKNYWSMEYLLIHGSKFMRLLLGKYFYMDLDLFLLGWVFTDWDPMGWKSPCFICFMGFITISHHFFFGRIFIVTFSKHRTSKSKMVGLFWAGNYVWYVWLYPCQDYKGIQAMTSLSFTNPNFMGFVLNSQIHLYVQSCSSLPWIYSQPPLDQSLH